MPPTVAACQMAVADLDVAANLDTAERDLIVELDPDVLARHRELVGIYPD